MTTDLRQGVTETQHAVLDQVDAVAASTDPAEYHLRLAARAAASAVRADPRTGNGRRRVSQAIEAAAHLLAALGKMDEAGKEKPR
ncbi:hypothetical protein [Sandarakinorhabdus sp.]|uniref:hypothetical protein n=1 Tax=Sandarakinorhabdus sp. TaxID=1916663 RepID=UPI00286D8F47|nr:hypothetical protein [Sandarakinorhabdus sp.]